MFLTPHAMVAVALTQTVDNPLAAFAVGFISHFILDMIPHGDAEFGPWVKRRVNRIKTISYIASIDLVLALMLVGMLVANLSLPLMLILPAFVGSILPDILWGMGEFFPANKPLRLFTQIHNSLHLLIPDRVSFRVGMMIQLITIMSAVIYMVVS